MSLYCYECGSRNLRQANFRLHDVVKFMMLRYPVRCRECRSRWYAPYFDARQLPHAPPRRTAAQRA